MHSIEIIGHLKQSNSSSTGFSRAVRQIHESLKGLFLLILFLYGGIGLYGECMKIYYKNIAIT